MNNTHWKYLALFWVCISLVQLVPSVDDFRALAAASVLVFLSGVALFLALRSFHHRDQDLI